MFLLLVPCRDSIHNICDQGIGKFRPQAVRRFTLYSVSVISRGYNTRMADLTVPLIFSPRNEPIRVHLLGRLFALAISLLCLAGLITAATLTPNPSGLGTHTALGLPACGFQQTLGIPCPSCGMTTSWAWFVRGDILRSFWVQPMGMVLAVMAAMAFWGGLYIAATGRAAHLLIRYVPQGYIVRPLLIFAILAWAWKIFIQHYHLDG
jgi:hypothetical protein